jgi:hypothetical protein
MYITPYCTAPARMRRREVGLSTARFRKKGRNTRREIPSRTAATKFESIFPKLVLIKPKEKAQMNAQVLNEIDFIVQRYNDLQPSLFLSYDRIALFGIEDKDFRITFDTNIRCRRYDLGLDIGIYGDLLLRKGQWIMEAKMNNTAPLWFAKLLSRYQIYPVSYSKYGSEYTNRVLSGSRNITKDYKKMCV